MKFKNLVALLLIVCMMLTVFVACGEKKDETDDVTDNGTVSDDANVNTDDGNEIDPDEIVSIELWLGDLGNAGGGSKSKDVAQAISDYAREKIGVEVNITWVSIPDLGTQATLAVSGNTTIDLLMTVPLTAGSYMTYYSNGTAKDFSAELNEYGQDIIALMDELGLIDAFTIDGGVYGLTPYRILNSNLYIVAKKEVLEHVGMLDAFQAMTSWSDYEAVLDAIANSDLPTYATGSGNLTMNVAGFMFGNGNFSDITAYDYLGDSNEYVYTDKNGNVSLVAEQEDMVASYKMFADWFSKGYIYADSAYNQDTTDVLITQGAFAAAIYASEFGVEAQKSGTYGTDAVAVQLQSGMLSTSSCTKFSIVVPVTSKETVGAVKFLNLLYTDEYLMNLITWGIEGETWEVNEDGYAAYIGDADASTSGYHSNDFLLGNQFLVTPWVGSDGADFRVRAEENLKGASVSAYMGLAVDMGEHSSLVSAISAVYAEYRGQINTGGYTDSLYAEFLSKLDSAGIDEYLGIYQTAVDEFMA